MVSSQNIKHKVTPNLLYDLLEKICSKDADDNYIFNKSTFKKGEYLGLIEPFCASLAESYHKSKQHYVTRKQTFITLVTVIRQVCKSIDIEYKSHIEYDKSSYNIVYSIRGFTSLQTQ